MQWAHILKRANLEVRHKFCLGNLATQAGSQVDRVRQFELGAARMEEATRYRRQLEDAREDLERVHAERLEQLRRREESQRERLQRQASGSQKFTTATMCRGRSNSTYQTGAARFRHGQLSRVKDRVLHML